MLAVCVVLLPLARGFMRLVSRQSEGREVVLRVGRRRGLSVGLLYGWQRRARRLMLWRRRRRRLLLLLRWRRVLRWSLLRRGRPVRVLRRCLRRDGRRRVVVGGRGRTAIDGRRRVLLVRVLRVGGRRRRRRVWGSPRVHNDVG